jgi:hypothetical protein
MNRTLWTVTATLLFACSACAMGDDSAAPLPLDGAADTGANDGSASRAPDASGADASSPGGDGSAKVDDATTDD